MNNQPTEKSIQNNMKKILTAVMFAAIVLTGCSKSDLSDGGTGTLRLSVSENSDLTVKSNDTTTDFSDYKVVFTKPSDSSYSLEYTYAKINETGTVELAPGKYAVTVTSPNTEDVAWEQPIYSGSSEFSIVSGKITEVSTTCTIQNIKVTVELSTAFTNEFTDYNVVVTGTYNDVDKSLTFNQEKISSGAAGWFNVTSTQTLSVYIKGTRQSGETLEQSGTISETSAADHHIISIDAVGTGSTSISITIDDTMNESTTEITVPGFDETPVEDEEGDTSGEGDDTSGEGDDSSTVDPSTAPTLVWEANPNFATMEITDDISVELKVSAPNGIETFKVGIESEELCSSLESIGNMSSPKLDLTQNPYDLINDEDAKTFLGNDQIGLPVGDELSGQISVDFVLTELIKMIPSVCTAGTSHTFILYVTDAKGLSLEQSLTFTVPEE